MAEKIIGQRRVAVPDFYGPGEDIYVDQLGWQEAEKKDAAVIPMNMER